MTRERPSIAELIKRTRALGVHQADDVLAGIAAVEPSDVDQLVSAWLSALATAKEAARKRSPSFGD